MIEDVSKTLRLFFLLIGIGIVWVAGIVFDFSQHRALAVHFFDIGQGDAILIRTPQQHTIVVDGGPDNRVINKLGQFLPFYQRTIDLLVLTHPDSDHLTGLNEVLARYRVNHVLLVGNESSSATYDAWWQALALEGAAVLDAGKTKYISLGFDSGLEVLYPQQSLAGVTVEESNAASVVVRLRYGDTSFLLTGDATEGVEEELLSHNAMVRSDVLKVAHHGSNTSSGQAFLQAVDPQLAIISAGVDNRFGHPHRVVLDRLNHLGVPILSTAALGDIIVFSDRQKLWYRYLKKLP